jgi:predicted acylesterase/phospholipase RssA
MPSLELFAALDEPLRAQLLSEARREQLRAGDVVIDEGDEASAFFVVCSGLLEVVVGPDARRLRLLRPGDPFGELALLAGTRRTATVRAVRDSEVWRIDGADFAGLVSAEAAFAQMVVKVLTRLVFESAPVSDATPENHQVYAVLPLHDGCDVDRVVEAFVRTGAPRSVALMSLDRETGPREWIERVDQATNGHDLVLLVASAARDEWFDFCVREADRVIALTDGRRSLEPLPHMVHADLVLLRDSSATSVAQTVNRFRPRAHHFVSSRDFDGSLARAMRRITRRSIGLVCSGGGARGFAHVGVLRALDEQGIVVDRFGGTSMGALVSGLAACGQSPREVTIHLRDHIVRRNPFRDYGVPTVALIRARRARTMLERLFGHRQIEELPRDFFCVSADLVSAEAVVHRTGPVVAAVGASMSLPGIAPPVRDGERLLVDGGVLDNLPVATMIAADEGPVIAIDVLARGLPGARRAPERLPTIVETLARATTLASRRAAESQRDLAAVTITPGLREVGLFEFAKIDAIIEAGRRAAHAASAELRDIAALR